MRSYLTPISCKIPSTKIRIICATAVIIIRGDTACKRIQKNCTDVVISVKERKISRDGETERERERERLKKERNKATSKVCISFDFADSVFWCYGCVFRYSHPPPSRRELKHSDSSACIYLTDIYLQSESHSIVSCCTTFVVNTRDIQDFCKNALCLIQVGSLLP